MHGKLKTNTNLLVSAYEKYHKDYLWRTSVNYCTSHQFYFTTEYTTISVLISLLLGSENPFTQCLKHMFTGKHDTEYLVLVL
jgi:hypothetical protein